MPKPFKLVLQYYPQSLVLKPKGHPDYKQCKDKRDPVALIVILRDLTHTRITMKNGGMATAKSDTDSYLIFQGKTKLINEHF